MGTFTVCGEGLFENLASTGKTGKKSIFILKHRASFFLFRAVLFPPLFQKSQSVAASSKERDKTGILYPKDLLSDLRLSPPFDGCARAGISSSGKDTYYAAVLHKCIFYRL